MSSKLTMWKFTRHTLKGASGLSVILFMILLNMNSTAALVLPTLETSISGNNLIFDKILPTPSISFAFQPGALLEANFTAQFESNSSDAFIDWMFLSSPKCNFTLNDALFNIFGFLTSWTNPPHRFYIPFQAYSFSGNQTQTESSVGDRQLLTYRFALGAAIRKMQAAYAPNYPKNITISDDSIPVIINGFVALSTSCGIQNSGDTYFADLKVSSQLEVAPEVELSVPLDATITFFSSNLVRLRPNVFWLPLTDSVQRFYVQYDLTPWYLVSPTKDFIVGTVTGFLTAVAIPVLTWTIRSVRAWKRKGNQRKQRQRLDWY